MKNYFVKFIKGEIDIYRSFFLHFLVAYVAGVALLVSVGSLLPDYVSVGIGLPIFAIIVLVAFVGTFFSALRTVFSGKDSLLRKLFSCLVISMLFAFLFYGIEDLKNLGVP